ncbi:hypothetical protein PHYBLDRAFT_140093 [Phycomyces blakesleeanus NRRL 1555(-)]|uniref:Uncharacterized protein n=1 Tax=Phycomyces blakesleeanus (strain ATCC 8743b / DSM 1359 / FGSC 10004 / NBRC 33097 / NRRL 1555) TaxID=763407 RepID=A0A167QQM1_PHYB8|nr:hypothetical protein PHYBLDRAFT_140093 [Phycomyces blakesleeanus NRRL 1555(-)]OAD80079.1 hypothetical protein PHYBLDRAFT_140093 [Phycomyces blakesleeanus NRRL 1555(-)]|eukprot:XP_018298119.1 hypothetical protein PHYBLDRAFT_140093 [Phycomyces blakesleeanus NRRL 1555(-)]
MNNGNNTTVNDPSLQRMMDNTSAMYSSNQLVLAQNLDQRPTNTTVVSNIILTKLPPNFVHSSNCLQAYTSPSLGGTTCLWAK